MHMERVTGENDEEIINWDDSQVGISTICIWIQSLRVEMDLALVDEVVGGTRERTRCCLEGGWIGILKTITDLVWKNAELN
jgi:hypothetical protein